MCRAAEFMVAQDLDHSAIADAAMATFFDHAREFPEDRKGGEPHSGASSAAVGNRTTALVTANALRPLRGKF
jgi:hypothetical protein